MFGSSQASSTPLFGAAPATSAPTQTPSLFGAPKPATPSLFGSAAPAAPSLSGAPSTPATSAAPKPTFSFGTPAPAASPTPGGGLFGTPAGGTTGTSTFGGFGAAPAATGGGLGMFGAPKPAAPAAGGLSMFGQPSAAPPAVPVLGATATSSITKRTKVNELPDSVRTTIENIDAAIRSQIQVAEELKTRDLGSEITKTSELYQQALAESTTVTNFLAEDSRAASELRSKLETDLSDLAKVTAIIEGFKNPQAKGAAAKSVANFPFEFFSRKAEEFKDRLKRYSSTMDQIQQRLESANGLERNPSAIIPTLRAQHASFMSLASAVASLDQDLKALKEDYTFIWRQKTGSVQDPFRHATGGGNGVGGVEGGVRGMDLR